MVNETSDRPRLTPKGARTRARIVEEAAALIHERGVAGTTLEDVKVAAEVSGSQMYHYFPDKNELVQAVIDYQADTIVNRQRHTLSSANEWAPWKFPDRKSSKRYAGIIALSARRSAIELATLSGGIYYGVAGGSSLLRPNE